MSTETMTALDAALAAHVADVHHGFHLAGYVVSYQVGSFQGDPDRDPLDTDSGYIAGPGTTPELAIGLARVAGLRLERFVLEADLE